MSESKPKRDNSENQSERVGEIVRIQRRGEVWYTNFQHGGKQVRKSLKTTSKKEARRRALAIERDLVNDDFQRDKPAPTIQTVIDEYTAYLRTEGRSPLTIGKYQHCFGLVQTLAAERHVNRITDVDLRFVDAFRELRVKEGAEPKTVLNDTVLIRQLINFALKRKLIDRDPLTGLELKKVKGKPQPFWTRVEVDQILATVKPPYVAPLTFLAETGTRLGELQHLTWNDVVLDGEQPHVRIQPKGDWKPKSGDMRVIPLSPRAVGMLRGLPRGSAWVFAARVSRRHPEAGRQVSGRRLLAYIKRVLKPLGLKGHLHAFRHSFISHALIQGVPEAIVRQWVGHVDRDIMEVYTHIADSVSHAAMQQLTQQSGRSCSSQVQRGRK